jgi:hypothetical protein
MSTSSDIDNALLAKLGADAQLLALCPDNVYWDIAPHGAQRFVTVSLVTATDESTYDAGPAIESILYAVKASLLNNNTDAGLAAARIHELLHNQTLTVAGYTCMTMHRDEDDPRIRMTEVDDKDPQIRWYHRGGNYRVEMTPT